MPRGIFADPGMTLKLVICLTGTSIWDSIFAMARNYSFFRQCSPETAVTCRVLNLLPYRVHFFPWTSYLHISSGIFSSSFLQSLTAHSPVCPWGSIQHYVHNLIFTFQTIPLQKIKPNSLEMYCPCFKWWFPIIWKQKRKKIWRAKPNPGSSQETGWASGTVMDEF